MKKENLHFHIVLGEPTVVYQGAPGDNKSGHYQFPYLHRTESGSILATWAYHNDSILGDGHSATAVTEAVSDDEGKSWRAKKSTDVREYKKCVLMKNGKYFGGFYGADGYIAEFLKEHAPRARGREFAVHFAEDLPEMPQDQFEAFEIDPKTGEIERFPIRVIWPFMPVQEVMRNRALVPVKRVMSICNETGIISINGDLYYCTYSAGFDSLAQSKEAAVSRYSGYFQLYIFKSTDNGRTWTFFSQVLVDEKSYNPDPCYEGFCEPYMKLMPDGSVIILMRTGGGLWDRAEGVPLYIVRSEDGCKTWSTPKRFDKMGVFPQLFTYRCGVTIATYGRPGMALRATSDPSGREWNDPIEIPLSDGPEWRSCYYTNLLELDDTTALLIYSDFHRPLPNGKGEARAITVRTVKVVLD